MIVDEAHRSQYDFIDAFARHMREAVPSASFIDFTGTPIELTDKKIRAVFGNYVSVYDIERAALPDEATPKAINVTLSFEEALKLHLSLGQLLGHLNGYNRSTWDGKRTAVNLSVETKQQQISFVEGRVRKAGESDAASLMSPSITANSIGVLAKNACCIAEKPSSPVSHNHRRIVRLTDRLRARILVRSNRSWKS